MKEEEEAKLAGSQLEFDDSEIIVFDDPWNVDVPEMIDVFDPIQIPVGAILPPHKESPLDTGK